MRILRIRGKRWETLSTISTETLEKLRKWSEKVGAPLEELKKRLEEKIKEVQEYHGLKGPAAEKRARFLLYSELKRELMSPAKWYEGVVVGYSEVFDITAPIRNEILAEYEANPEKAVAEGKVKIDDDGNVIPIDLRERLPNGQPNPNYKKPITPVPIRNMVAVTRPVSGGDWKLTIITARMDQVDNLPPLGEHVKFRALESNETPDRRYLRTSRVTQYVPTTIEDLPKSPVELLRQAPESLKKPLVELARDPVKVHDEIVSNDPQRLLITEGDVVYVGDETERGNVPVMIEDEEFDFEDESITVWVHKDIRHLVNWGPGTRIVVVGSVSLNNRDPEKPRIMVNAWGVFNDPELTFGPE